MSRLRSERGKRGGGREREREKERKKTDTGKVELTFSRVKNATSSSSLSSLSLSTLRRLFDVADAGGGGRETDRGMNPLVDGFGVGVGIGASEEELFGAKLIEFFGGGRSDNKFDLFFEPVTGTNGFFVASSSSESPRTGAMIRTGPFRPFLATTFGSSGS